MLAHLPPGSCWEAKRHIFRLLVSGHLMAWLRQPLLSHVVIRTAHRHPDRGP
jgi:hypothetical protein